MRVFAAAAAVGVAAFCASAFCAVGVIFSLAFCEEPEEEDDDTSTAIPDMTDYYIPKAA